MRASSTKRERDAAFLIQQADHDELAYEYLMERYAKRGSRYHRMMQKGWSTAEIAAVLGLHPRTVQRAVAVYRNSFGSQR